MSEEHELHSISNHLSNMERYLKRIARALEIANGHTPEEEVNAASSSKGEASVFYPDR